HDLPIGITRDADGQEAHEAEILICVDFQAEFADVEVDGLILIEHVDLRDSEAAEHVVGSLVLRGGRAPTLPGGPVAVFSKTARSRPRHGEARWYGDDLRSAPVRGRRFADDDVKCLAECAQ